MGIYSAIDEVRAEEATALKAEGYEPMLTKTLWVLLKRPKNLSEQQSLKLNDLLRNNLKAVRAYLLKEDFQIFWSYTSAYWEGQFLDHWCTRTLRSKIEPKKKIAKKHPAAVVELVPC